MSQIHKIWQYLLLLLTFYSATTFALSEDDKKNINATADFYHIDLINGVFTYKGHVVMDQGSRHITCDEATVYRKDGKLDKIEMKGAPVRYQSKNDDPNKPMIYAKSNIMIYEAPKHLLTLIDKAEVKQGNDIATSEHIEYQTEQRIVTMTPVNGSRSTIVIEPDSMKTPSAHAKTPKAKA